MEMNDTAMDIPILQISNEKDEGITLLIEPHLDFYILGPHEICDLYYCYPTDNTVPDKFLTVAYRKKEIVVYAPGSYAPVIKKDGILLKPQIA